MADSGSEHGSDGSDNEDDSAGFDPAKDMEKLSDKDKKKWEKRLQQWRIFMDFIFRHVTIVTYKFNKFEKEKLTQFMLALEKAESLREKQKMKKGETPQITSYKTMKEGADLLTAQKFMTEANRIRDFLNIAGRMRGIGTIASGFYKAMKKGKLKGTEKIKYYADFWKGFTVRSFNYSELQFKNTDPVTFNALEKKFLVWPTVVKTSLHLAQRFLKKASDASGLDLLSPEDRTIHKYLEGPEFFLASKIEDHLFDRVEEGAKNFMLGLGTPGLGSASLGGSNSGTQTGSHSPDMRRTPLPNVDDVDPDFLKPIPENGVLLELPPDPPKEKKGGKKGKKGKGSAKGRGASASSHKGGKKKKKK